jgi:membrane protein implicated in regulation of membrane protease activity
MDDINLYIGGVFLLPLVFGLVEFFKAQFSLEGKIVTWLSAGIALVLAVIAQLETVIPGIAPWVKIAVLSVCAGLSASGVYKFTSARLPKTDRPY